MDSHNAGPADNADPVGGIADTGSEVVSAVGGPTAEVVSAAGDDASVLDSLESDLTAVEQAIERLDAIKRLDAISRVGGDQSGDTDRFDESSVEAAVRAAVPASRFDVSDE